MALSNQPGSFKPGLQRPQPSPPPPPPKVPVEDEPIALVDADESISIEVGSPGGSGMAAAIRPMGAPGPSAVRAIKSTLEIDKRAVFKRTPVNTGKGAVRCRVFHSKIAESSMEHMQNQINAWLDDEDVDIKHVGHMVGALEGKHTEPNIIVVVWY